MPITLNSIILSNFKSIRGKVTITPFPTLTAIIGPNGSGKSNIMDGVKFALGEKPDALRVNCLSELVHGAIIGKPRMEGTYAKIVFMGDNNEEKSFMRTIYGEESIYNIDSETVTHNFYMAKLKEFGLDVKLGTFLVSQGYAECFALQLPKELTVTFEMISGSNTYKEIYERFKKKNEKLKEKIHHTFQVKKQLAIQKTCAIAEAKEAKMYLELQKQYIEMKTKFQLVQLVVIKKAVQIFQNKERKKKLQIEKCSNDRKEVMILYERHKLEFMSLAKSLKVVEGEIQTSENISHNCKADRALLAGKISYCRENYDYAHARLAKANKARDVHISTIQELKDTLEDIENQLKGTKRASHASCSTMELADSQIKRYWDLKNKAECRAKDLIEQINKLMRDQEPDRNKFENENRIKEELKDKIKRATSSKDNLKTLLIRLENSNAKFKATLENKIVEKQNLIKKINETKETSSKLESEIQKISEELDQSYYFVDITAQERKKIETIKNLKRFSGMYGRLSQLCKPIHSRYYVPMIQVFGKYLEAIIVDNINTAKQCIEYLKQQKLDAETFLPLDSIKPVCLRERLRDIKEPKNVKLLFDVLEITSVQIAHAILFVTKNTLVCETAKDAKRMAYEIDKPNTYDCVSLDGCFYRKSGLFSGGQTDLISKAKNLQKQVERKALDICALKKRKEELNVKKLPNISQMQSNLDILEIEIKKDLLKVKYIQQDIKDSKSKIEEIDEILQELAQQLSLSNSTISEIQYRMQETNKNIESIQKNIDAIKHEIFADFCDDNNISHISIYENNLRIYKDEEEKRMELEKLYNYIKNQLHFESKHDTKSEILRWTHALEQVDAKLSEARQQETLINSKIEQEEIKLSKLKVHRARMESNLKYIETKLAEIESEIRKIEKLHFENEKAHIAIQKQIEQKKAECNAVLEECKMEGITIPIAEMLHGEPGTSTSSTSTSVELLNDILKRIDFLQFPKDILNSSEKDLQNSIVLLDKTLTEIQNQIEAIINPNLKVDREKIDSMAKKISNLNKTIRILRQEAYQTERALNEVKEKRNKEFSNCLECVAAAVDPIYKNLVKEKSAQAILLSDNLGELYAGGLHYSCIPPFKRFQPISNLSGGEKSLASLALQFAIQRYKPAPFFFMDEGDASLDNTNLKKVIRFIQSHFTEDDMKVIMITLQKSMFSRFNVLVGVTTEPDAECTESKIFSISLDKYSSRGSK